MLEGLAEKPEIDEAQVRLAPQMSYSNYRCDGALDRRSRGTEQLPRVLLPKVAPRELSRSKLFLVHFTSRTVEIQDRRVLTICLVHSAMNCTSGTSAVCAIQC